MKLLCVGLCILTLPFYLLHLTQTESALPSVSLSIEDQISGRRLMKELSSSASKLEIDGGMKRSETNGDSVGDDEGIVYNVDYHGVTTHPSLLPRHPKP